MTPVSAIKKHNFQVQTNFFNETIQPREMLGEKTSTLALSGQAGSGIWHELLNRSNGLDLTPLENEDRKPLEIKTLASALSLEEETEGTETFSRNQVNFFESVKLKSLEYATSIKKD